MTKRKDGSHTGNNYYGLRLTADLAEPLQRIMRKLKLTRSEAIRKAIKMLIEAHS